MADEHQVTPPRLSEAAIEDYRRLLTPAFERDFPERYAMLKASVDQALSATGQSLAPPPDARSAAQQIHDQRMGVSYAGDRVALPEPLAAVLARDVAGEAPDKEVVTRHLDRVGLDYEETVAAAQATLLKTGSQVDATKLSAHALNQLAIYGEHLRRHSATRPA
jgi:hypothetical protein